MAPQQGFKVTTLKTECDSVSVAQTESTFNTQSLKRSRHHSETQKILYKSDHIEQGHDHLNGGISG